MRTNLIKKPLGFSLVALVIWFIYPVARVTFFLLTDPIQDDRSILANETLIDDASGKNQTKHSGILRLPADLNHSIALLRKTLTEARREGKKMIPFGARHSMGKQSIQENAIHIDLKNLRAMKLEDGLLRVEAGARWNQVLNFLAPRGLAVEVMQSNADFSIGGTLSVNAHGWQPDRPPVASTVDRIRIMTADGELKICSRTENQNLFRHALGGILRTRGKRTQGLSPGPWISPNL